MTAAFVAFAFLLAAFNRAFVYLHVDVAGRPVFVSEIFLALMIALLAMERRRVKTLIADSGTGARTVLGLCAFLVLFALGKAAHDAAKFGIESVRQAALGYYTLALPVSYAVLRDHGARDRVFRAVAAASVVSTVLFILQSAGFLGWDKTFLRDFHGLGAFVWIGLVACFVLATGRANFWSHPGASALFLFQCVAGFTLAGRSVFAGLLLALGVIAFTRRRVITRREVATLIVCAVMVGGMIELRSRDLIRFGAQDTWKESWESYRSGITVMKRFGRRATETVAPAVRAPKVTAGRDAVVYDGEAGTLSLASALLNDQSLLGVFTASMNNVLWRAELWRLSTLGVVRNGVLFGLPLGVAVRYQVFGEMMPGRVDLHNSHLAFFFRFGLVGFAAYAVIVGISLFIFWSGASRPDGLSLSFFGGLLYMIVLASFNVLLEGPYGALAFWGLIGAGLAAALEPRNVAFAE